MVSLFGEPIADPVTLPEMNDLEQVVESNRQLATSTERRSEIESAAMSSTGLAAIDINVPVQRQSFSLFALLGWLWALGFVAAVSYLLLNYVRFLILVSSAKAATAKPSDAGEEAYNKGLDRVEAQNNFRETMNLNQQKHLTDTVLKKQALNIQEKKIGAEDRRTQQQLQADKVALKVKEKSDKNKKK